MLLSHLRLSCGLLRRLAGSPGRRLHAGVLEAARAHAQRTALVDDSGSYTYGALLSRAGGVAAQVNRAVPGPGARVCFLAPNSHQYVALQWGIWMSGNVAVPLCRAHPAAQLQYYVDDSQAAAVLSTPDYAGRLEGTARAAGVPLLVAEPAERGAEPEPEPEPARRDSSDPAMILYTSGTTGPPKGVVLSHGNLLSQVRDMVTAWEWRPSDVILHTLPLHHTHGIVNALMCPLYVGARCVMLPDFDAARVWWELLDTVPEPSDQINVFMAVPTIYAKLLEEYRRKSKNNIAYQSFVKSVCSAKIRLMVSGSAALARPIMDEWEAATGHRLLERYGMSEIGMALTNPLHGVRHPGAVGGPFPSVEVRVARFQPRSEEYTVLAESDSSGTTVTPGWEDQEGELLVRGPSVFSGYWRRPEVTRKEFTADGWFRTGDTAAFRPREGGYRILGRTSVDIIKTGGFKVSALDVERRLLEHRHVEDVAVVGLPDLTWGQKVAAVVVTSAELELDQLKAWCRQTLPPYASPTVLRTVPQMPRNVMGKVNKKEVVKTLFPDAGSGA